MTRLDRLFLEMSDEEWASFLKNPEMVHRFLPEERRRRAVEKLPPEMESLAGDLSVDGYDAWGEFTTPSSAG